MQLTAVRVRDYLCLEDTGFIPIAHPTVLTGPNGSGKSTLLRAIRFLLEGDNPPPPSDLEDAGTPPLPVVEGLLELSDIEQDRLSLGARVRVRRKSVDGRTALEVQTMVPLDERFRDVRRLGVADLRALLAADGLSAEGLKPDLVVRAGAAIDRAPAILGWRATTHDEQQALPELVWFASTEEPDAEREVRASLLSSFDDFARDPSVQGRIEEIEDKARERLDADAQRIVQVVRKRCPELDTFEVQPEVGFKNGLGAVRLVPSGFSFDAIGAGERRRISLAVWEATSEGWQTPAAGAPIRDRLVVYDEPDTHLDYGRQRELMTLILDQANAPGSRVIVATHSHNLIDGVDPEGVVAFKPRDGADITPEKVLLLGAHHGDVRGHLSGVTACLGIRNSVLVNERCFVLVEGPSEIAVFPVLYRLSTGSRPEAHGVTFVNSRGNTSALELARHLLEQRRDVRLVVDRDSLRRKKEFASDRLLQVGLGADRCEFLGSASSPDGQGEELECLFADDVWTDLLDTNWPRQDGGQWKHEEIAALRATSKKFSSDLEQLVKDNARPDAHAGWMAPSKAHFMETLALQVSDRNHVPEELHAVFAWISRDL